MLQPQTTRYTIREVSQLSSDWENNGKNKNLILLSEVDCMDHLIHMKDVTSFTHQQS